MKVRLFKNSNVKGTSSKFNTESVSEVIVNFDDGDSDSACISDLDVYVNGVWISLTEAFKQKLIITDNYNTHFFEPKDEEEKKRGYRS